MEGSGVPQLRPTNILPDGEVTFEGAKFIPVSRVAANDLVESGEVLFNNTNSTAWVGKSVLLEIPTRQKVVCSNHVTRIRLSDQDNGYFVAEILNLMQRRGFFGRLSTNFNNQAGINVETLNEVVIPLTTDEHRDKLVSTMKKARVARKGKLAEAESLLAGLGDAVLDHLGLTLPEPQQQRNTYAVLLKNDVHRRFDPHYHTPQFLKLIKKLDVFGALPLSSVFDLSEDRVDPIGFDAEWFQYIEISGVNASTGEVMASSTRCDEAPSRARMLVKKDDLIVSLTRPQRGSIAQISDELDKAVASTGFAVIRKRKDVAINLDYAWGYLRSSAALNQMLQRSSGGNYPAITEEELSKILIPVPDEPLQSAIAAEVTRRRDEARKLRAEAEALWEQAKADFEAALIGPSTTQAGGQ